MFKPLLMPPSTTLCTALQQAGFLFPSLSEKKVARWFDLSGCCWVYAGALRRHAEMYSPDVVSEERQQLVRAMLPFGFPRDFRSPAGSLRNVWCFVSVPSAFNVSSGAAARLRETSKLMNRLKEGMQPLALFLLQNYLLAWFPISVTRRVNTDSFQRHSMIFTNVPGNFCPFVPPTRSGRSLSSF